MAASPWATSAAPFSQLREECRGLLADEGFGDALRGYLGNHAAVRRAFEMFFTFIAMAASAKWQDAPEQFRGVAARGWFLGRWIPTFLIGPVGRFVLSEDSPLATPLASGSRPLLQSARRFSTTGYFGYCATALPIGRLTGTSLVQTRTWLRMIGSGTFQRPSFTSKRRTPSTSWLLPSSRFSTKSSSDRPVEWRLTCA